MRKVLVVEDCEDVRALLMTSLDEQFEVTAASSISEARQTLQKAKFDAVILDLRLPDGTGSELCSWLRSDSRFNQTAVLVLSSEQKPSEKVMAFSAGADDYVEKPFDSNELLARLNMRLLNRVGSKSEPSGETLKKGALEFDTIGMRVQLKTDAGFKDLALTPTEFKLLYLLVRNEGRAVSRAEIVKHVWPTLNTVSDATLYTHISTLRKKIENERNSIRLIQNVGYQYVPLSKAV